MESISVIIPTWNRQEKLIKAVKSVLNQTYQPLEILVCDDGSTDNSQELVLAIGDPRIKWLKGKHTGGPATARNRGIKNAHGDWLAFLDSDDTWAQDKLEKQLLLASTYNYKLICTNGFRLKGISKEKYLINHKDLKSITLKSLLGGNKVICSSVLVRKTVMEVIDGFPTQTEYIAIEDYLAWLKTLSLYKVGYIPDPLVYYHDAPNNSIRSRWSDFGTQKSVALKYVRSWLLSNPHVSLKYLDSYVKITREMKNENSSHS